MTGLWDSGHVNRWHNNPHHGLRNSGDTVWQHAARCTYLMCRIFPDADAHLLLAVLMHDAAESVTGDTPATAKSGDIRAALERTERTFNEARDIPTPRNKRERYIMRLVDRLDAYLWARSIDARIVDAQEWHDQLEAVIGLSADLGVSDEVLEILNE